MNRRNVCRALCALSVTLAVRAAAQPAVPYRITWVSMDDAAPRPPMLDAFREGMSAIGYVEGKSYVVDALWGGGSADRLQQMTQDRLRDTTRGSTDIFVVQGGAALPPVLRSVKSEPVVFSISADPVEGKFVRSYAHPGGNVTGITLFTGELVAKRIALLQEVLPRMQRLAVLANPQHPGAGVELQNAKAAASRLSIDLLYFPASTEAELDAAFAKIAGSRVDAVIAFTDGFALASAERIAAFSLRQRVPVASGWAEFARRGNLMTYGPVFTDVYRRLATYVDRIRKGADPADLPVEQPTRLELVINMHTAKALGIAIPQTMLLRADEIIQ